MSELLGEVFERGQLSIVGRLPAGSNITLLCKVKFRDSEYLAIFKPEKGERPLWDFEPGLYKREICAYLLSELASFSVVPLTVLKFVPELGVGSLQCFINANFDLTYFDLLDNPNYADQLFRIAVFDYISNNADRKASHFLLDENEKIWAIDHGLCFSREPKLRTVAWDFVNEPLCESLLKCLEKVLQISFSDLNGLLEKEEFNALKKRTERLLELGALPDFKGDHYPYPWPVI